MTMRLDSLRKITELKSKLTQQANWRYAESLRDLETEQSKLHQLETSHDQAAVELHLRATNCVSAQEVHEWTMFMIGQRKQIEDQTRVIARSQSVCTDKHGELTDCFMDEQVWNRLQDRRQLEHQSHLNRVAQEMLDEMAVTGYRRIRG
ncbi:MAG: flagellar export protein FliJ [Tumebacillaceae bacterium]